MWKWRILLFLVIALVLSVGVLIIPHSREPSYAGRSLSEWILEYASSRYAASNEAPSVTLERNVAARKAILSIGAKGNPFVLQWINYKPNARKNKIYELVGRVLHIFERDWKYRDRGLMLGNALMDAAPLLGLNLDENAINELNKIIRDAPKSPAWYRALEICSSAGPKAVPIFACALTNAPSGLQPEIIFSMNNFGTNLRPVLPLVIHYLQDQSISNQVTRLMMDQNCLYVLGRYQRDPEVVIPAILPFLEDGREDIAVDAFSAIGRFGPAARPWAAEVGRFTNDPSARIRQTATNTLFKIGVDERGKAGVE